jgi:hypothetical protein
MQNTLFSMITFLTTVLMVSSAWAQDDSKEANKLESAGRLCGVAPEAAATDSQIICIGKIGGGAGTNPALFDTCADARKEVDLKRSEFSKACDVFRLKGVSCAEKVFNCPGDVEEVDDSEDKKDKTVENDRYDVCPLPAVKDAKLAKEKIRELKEEIEKVEDEIKTAKEKVQESQKDIETAEAERLEANNEREAQYERESKEKNLEQDEKTEAAQKKIDEIDKAMRELEQTKNDQDVQYSVDLAKIEGICEDIAEKALAAQIEGTVKAVQAGQLKKRDLNAQLALASSGRTKQNEDFRKREIARCRADDAKWKKPIELLNLNYQNTRLKIENGMKELLLQKNKTYTELNSTLPQKKQQEAQELLTRYQKDVATIKTKFDTKIGQCGNFQAMQGTKPKQTQSPNGCTGLQGILAKATAEQANLEAKLEDKKSDLVYYTDLLRVASAAISSPDAEDKGLLGAAYDYRSAIIAVGSCGDGLEKGKYTEYVAILNGMDTGSKNTPGEGSSSIRLKSEGTDSVSANTGSASAPNPSTPAGATTPGSR